MVQIRGLTEQDLLGLDVPYLPLHVFAKVYLGMKCFGTVEVCGRCEACSSVWEVVPWVFVQVYCFQAYLTLQVCSVLWAQIAAVRLSNADGNLVRILNLTVLLSNVDEN